MYRRVVTAALVVLVVFGLAGCSNMSSGASTPDAKTTTPAGDSNSKEFEIDYRFTEVEAGSVDRLVVGTITNLTDEVRSGLEITGEAALESGQTIEMNTSVAPGVLAPGETGAFSLWDGGSRIGSITALRVSGDPGGKAITASVEVADVAWTSDDGISGVVTASLKNVGAVPLDGVAVSVHLIAPDGSIIGVEHGDLLVSPFNEGQSAPFKLTCVIRETGKQVDRAELRAYQR